MTSEVRLHCPNCGTDFTPPLLEEGEASPESYPCPVCQFQVTGDAPVVDDAVSLDDLSAQLDALLAQARSGGIPIDDITRVLRDELEFHAELAHGGRRFVVQIIDLGPQSLASGDTLVSDSREQLHSRGQLIDKTN